MKFRRRRSSRLPRPDFGAAPKAAVRGAVWTRSETGSPVDRGRPSVRGLAAAGAALELFLLGFLFWGPAFAVRHVDVAGTRRLSQAQVVTAAGLARPGSVFGLDADGIARRLGGTIWVRSATVSVELPDRVAVQVDEWQPVADYRAGPGSPFYVSDQGVVLGPAAAADGLLEIDGPAGAEPRPGGKALEPRLLTALVNIQRQLPTLLPGQEVRSFAIDGCGSLTMTAKKGWQAQFGRVLTPEEYASLAEKLAALKSVSTKVDYNSSDLLYVNVMNPAAAAVGTRSGQAAAAKPAPAPKSSPGARSTPAPTPAPTPTQAVAACR